MSYNEPPYSYPPNYYQGYSYPESSNAVVVFVLGLLGVVMCQVLGPVAWVIGKGEVDAIDAGRRPPDQRGLAVAGKILGIVATVLLGLGILFFLLYIILIIGVLSSSASTALPG